MRVKISGLDPHQQYYITMDIIPVDNKRYRLGIKHKNYFYIGLNYTTNTGITTPWTTNNTPLQVRNYPMGNPFLITDTSAGISANVYIYRLTVLG